MDKKRLFKILAKSSRDKVIALGSFITDRYDVTTVKKPAKTLVMLKMRESTAGSAFFLGELLACEAMVEIDNKRGMALTAGDDFEKVFAMALVDAAMNAKIAEADSIKDSLLEMEKRVIEDENKEFGRNMKSKVEFRIMEDR